MTNLDILDEEIGKPTVFIDESKLSSEYLPTNLHYRTEDLRVVVRHYRGLFTPMRTTRKLIIVGPVGSGKTTIAKTFGQLVQNKSNKDSLNIKYVHINCRRNKSAFMILLAIIRELNSHVPARGYSADELMEMIVDLLEAQQITMLLVLDEVDYAIDKGSIDLIYALTRTSDDRQNADHRIALILIARSSNFLSALDSSTSSSLSAAIMKLDPYNREQLFKIVTDRVEQSFIPNAVTQDSIMLVSEIAAIRGDARQALELMWYAGKFADTASSSTVYPEHVRLAKANIEPALLRRAIEEFSIHKLLLILAIAQKLKQTRKAYLTTGDAEYSYQILCEGYGEIARKHTQIWEYIKELVKLGIIVTEKSGAGLRGNTQLLSIHDVSATELEHEVKKLLQNIHKKSTVSH